MLIVFCCFLQDIPGLDKPWFSLLPLDEPLDNFLKFEELRRELYLASTDDKTQALLQAQCPVNPQIALLELKLEEIKKANVCSGRDEIPIRKF